MRLCSVSVDLDEIPNYFAIHGLKLADEAAASAVYELAIPRLRSWAAAHGIPLTLFAVGADLKRAASAAMLRSMAELGHELANHTLDHRYDLTRLPYAEQLRQIAQGAESIRAATGYPVSGFRAPGYTMTDDTYHALEAAEVRYSSSVFPCAPYYLAKAAAMAAIRLRGSTSFSILDTPNVLLAPTEPYRVGTPYWERGHGLLELPVQVTRFLKLPFIGTTVTLFGPERARWLTEGVLGLPFVNLELHGIDVLDARDGLGALEPFQPDVRIPLQRKLDALSAVVEMLKRNSYGFVRLDEAASAV